MNEPAVASAQLLDLGPKLYPSNMPHILDLCRVFLEEYAKIKQTKERLCLVAGWGSTTFRRDRFDDINKQGKKLQT